MWTQLVTLAIAVVGLAGATQIPRFDDFYVPERFAGKSAIRFLVQTFRSGFEHRFVGKQRSPNFAGRYRIAEWGCGSSCVSIAVIDLSTGVVHDGPFVVLGYGERNRYEGGEDYLEYRISSRLLIVRGCPEDNNCGTYYYAWDGHKFSQIRYIPAETPATPVRPRGQ